MRRPKYDLWETEARDAKERLRQALAVLLEQEMARDAGAVEGEQFFDALNTANRITASRLESSLSRRILRKMETLPAGGSESRRRSLRWHFSS